MRLLQFPIFDDIPHFHHAITTRDGGFSRGEFSGLNLAFHVGDDAETVRRNRRALASELGFDAEKLVAAQQVHSNNCAIVTAQDAGRGALDWDSALPDTDALICAERDLPLLILVADCAPILLVEPKTRIFAVVHAGWRGAKDKIASRAVRQMIELGADVNQIRAGIGPCLCAENLEVGRDVAARIEDENALEICGEEYRLDLRVLIKNDLNRTGVRHIEMRAECPKRENETFFSHRGQNGTAGRFGIVAWLS